MGSNGQAIPAFLINLARRPERLERVSGHLQSGASHSSAWMRAMV